MPVSAVLDGYRLPVSKLLPPPINNPPQWHSANETLQRALWPRAFPCVRNSISVRISSILTIPSEVSTCTRSTRRRTGLGGFGPGERIVPSHERVARIRKRIRFLKVHDALINESALRIGCGLWYIYLAIYNIFPPLTALAEDILHVLAQPPGLATTP